MIKFVPDNSVDSSSSNSGASIFNAIALLFVHTHKKNLNQISLKFSVNSHHNRRNDCVGHNGV